MKSFRRRSQSPKRMRVFVLVTSALNVCFYIVPAHLWREDFSPLYQPLDAGSVERLKVRTPTNRIISMWMDEEGQWRRKSLNVIATNLAHRVIVGTIALELGYSETEERREDCEKLYRECLLQKGELVPPLTIVVYDLVSRVPVGWQSAILPPGIL